MDEDTSLEERRARLGSRTDSKPATIGAGYSRFVKLLRLLLPLAALLIIVLLMTWHPEDSGIMPAVSKDTATSTSFGSADVQQNELLNPHFESRTKDGQPYRITAIRATQKSAHPDLIYMEQLKATLDMDTDRVIHLSADDATYDQKTQFMTLTKNIIVETETNERLYLSALEADLAGGEAFSPQPARGESPDGTITGQTMRITHQGNRIIFTGPAKLILHRALEGIE